MTSLAEYERILGWVKPITYLPTDVRGRYFYLYRVHGHFSRKIVGWQIYDTESSERASEVMRDIAGKTASHRIRRCCIPNNGSPMKSATMLATLQTLSVAPSFSRPAVSNDIPYLESPPALLRYRCHQPDAGRIQNLKNCITATQYSDDAYD